MKSLAPIPHRTKDRLPSDVLRAAEIILLVTFWITALLWDAFGWWLAEHLSSGSGLRKMAVAVIDNRTTDCCQQVHGQVQAIGDPFVLTGEPRFADRMQWPGFHYRCRTSVAVVLLSNKVQSFWIERNLAVWRQNKQVLDQRVENLADFGHNQLFD